MSQHSRDYENQLREIATHLDRGEYESCVADCGSLFEMALKELLMDLLPSLRSSTEREEIHIAEKEAAKTSEQTFHDFGLGQLIGLYRRGKVFDKIRRQKDTSLRKTMRIKWDELCDLRNAASHRTGEVDEDDARQMYFWIKCFLRDVELMTNGEGHSGTTHEAEPRSTVCGNCKGPIAESWKFCPQCGTSIFNICAECHRHLKPEWKRCPYCEAPVRGVVHGENAAAKHEYQLLCRGAYLDGFLNAREKKVLEEKRLELGLSVEETDALERICIPPPVLEYQHYLEGVYANGFADERDRVFLTKKAVALGLDLDLAAEIEAQFGNPVEAGE